MRNNLPRFIMSFGILYLMSFIVSPVLACSPSQEAMNLTLEDRVENAPMILIGTAVQGFTTSYGNGYEIIREIEVEVETYLRGEGPAIVRISGFGDGADCLSYARLNERLIFFVEGDPDTGLQANYTGVHDATWGDSQENIDTIIAITGENNAPYPLPLTTQLIRFVMQYAIWIITLSLLAIVFAFAPMILRRIRQPRKSKAKRN